MAALGTRLRMSIKRADCVASAFDEEWMSMVRVDILLLLLGVASVLSRATMWSQLAQSSTLAMRHTDPSHLRSRPSSRSMEMRDAV